MCVCGSVCVCIATPEPTKEADGPFPWQTSLGKPSKCKRPGELDQSTSQKPDSHSLGDPRWEQWLPTQILSKPCFQNMVSQAASIGRIDFQLPKKKSLAGAVLHHSVGIMESFLKKQSPAIFKIGWTHDCCWRWSNTIYGYGHSLDKWSHMTVMYISDEPYTPAMLEAALIEKYSGTMPI